MLCNINQYNNTNCIFDNANGFYIFSLLPHILVHKDHDFKLMHDCMSAYPDVYLSPKMNLS